MSLAQMSKWTQSGLVTFSGGTNNKEMSLDSKSTDSKSQWVEVPDYLYDSFLILVLSF